MNPHSRTSSSILDDLRQQQVAAWQQGHRLLVEHLIAQNPDDPLDDEQLLELICAELLLREDAGEVPAADEYQTRFPRLADSLQRQLEVNRLLGSLDGVKSMSVLLSGDFSPESPTATSTLASEDESSFPEVEGYRILQELGRGGMGVVYRALHLQLNRIVALKMIRDSALAGTSARERFRVEGKAIARLRHPNIVQIYHYSEVGGVPYFSLEYLAGGTLANFTQNHPQPIAAVCALVEKLARAVEHAHKEGIVHRDLKPANILLTRVTAEGSAGGSSESAPAEIDLRGIELSALEPKISDFGLAKSLSEELNLTQSAAMLGTCAYMSPEQAWGRSRDVGPATDIHALGLILYELLTGVAPFQAKSLAESLDLVRFTTPTPPSQLRPDVPTVLDEICERCLRKEPAERFHTAAELAEALRQLRDPESVKRRPPVLIKPTHVRNALIIAGGISLALCLSAFWWIPDAETNPNNRNRPPARVVGEPFAFLVGVRSYRLPGQSIDLEFTESDVDELSRVLFRQGYPRKNIHLLTQWNESDNPELAPTGSNIRKQLQSLVEKCIPADTVLVAVTGMGGDLGNPPMYCYLPADGRPGQADSLMTLADFYDLFRKCRARQKILLVDTCQTVVADRIDWKQPPELPPGMAVFFACAPNEASYEHVSLRHGVFSYHILKALEGAADSNHDGVIELNELVRYATSHVQEFVADKYPNATQSPYLIGNLPGTTPVVRLNQSQ